MTSSASSHVEGCDLKALGSAEIVLLSRCWREDKVRMTHRIDGRVDLSLICEPGGCGCLRSLRASP